MVDSLFQVPFSTNTRSASQASSPPEREGVDRSIKGKGVYVRSAAHRLKVNELDVVSEEHFEFCF